MTKLKDLENRVSKLEGKQISFEGSAIKSLKDVLGMIKSINAWMLVVNKVVFKPKRNLIRDVINLFKK